MESKIFQYNDSFRIGVKGKVYHGERLITFHLENDIFVAISTIIKADGYKFIQIEQSPDTKIFNVGEKYVFEQFEAA